MSGIGDFVKKLGRVGVAISTGGLSEVARNNKNLIFGEAPDISSQPTLSPEQQQLMKLLMQTLMPSIGTPTTDDQGNVTWAPSLAGGSSYPGKITPELQGTNKALMGKIMDAISSGGINSKQIKGAIKKYSADFDSTGVERLFEKSVKPKAMRTFNEEILPQIAEKFAGRNAFESGGTYHEMVKAGTDLGSDLAGQLEEMISTAREGHLNRNATVLPQLLTRLNEGFTGLLPFAGALGQTEQDLATARGQEEYGKWATSQPYNNPMLNLIMQALGMQTQQNVVKPGSEGLLPTLIAGGSKILASVL